MPTDPTPPRLVTEAGDYLTTEAGDYLTVEGAQPTNVSGPPKKWVPPPRHRRRVQRRR